MILSLEKKEYENKTCTSVRVLHFYKFFPLSLEQTLCTYKGNKSGSMAHLKSITSHSLRKAINTLYERLIFP